MKMYKIVNVLAAMLLTGVAGLAGSAYAAENASGVKEHMALTVQTTKEALTAANSDNKDGCLASIKQAKQHYKEITGDAAGKPLQDAMRKINEARDACSQGATGHAAEILTGVVKSMETIQAGIK